MSDDKAHAVSHESDSSRSNREVTLCDAPQALRQNLELTYKASTCAESSSSNCASSVMRSRRQSTDRSTSRLGAATAMTNLSAGSGGDSAPSRRPGSGTPAGALENVTRVGAVAVVADQVTRVPASVVMAPLHRPARLGHALAATAHSCRTLGARPPRRQGMANMPHWDRGVIQGHHSKNPGTVHPQHRCFEPPTKCTASLTVARDRLASRTVPLHAGCRRAFLFRLARRRCVP